MNPIYTIGHSTQSLDRFLNLLTSNGITAIADVRSAPYSRMNPQFNRESLKVALRAVGISYVYLGAELGARCDDQRCYIAGKVQYDRLGARPEFVKGLERVETGAAKYTVALMCAEGDPLTCHRTILVSKRLAERGAEVRHLRTNGEVETHEQAVARLLREVGLEKADLFVPQAQRIEQAFKAREAVIAYVQPAAGSLADEVEANL